ncbi:hypothetical protein [Phytohabitans suffuscus]|uniref:Uncharacterized protein n=1 Tax=Phytohabitans suffuscus TaxID=624315 RepID=A0A6F8YWS1_9ACTN|nr:hypothetical protein [Phytohabitans suffuscus]BCB90504.1 hypothetical protein Psuf_078170 [Phytohabitans suffuscus]
MNGMEFTWRMVGVLAWPGVTLALLVLYRGWITSALAAAAGGRPARRPEAGPGAPEWESTLDEAGRSVAGVLAGTAVPPGDGAPVPSNLVDLLPMATANPRRGIRTAFHQVRRALAQVHPRLAGTPDDLLTPAMRALVRQGAMDEEVERAVSQLHRLYELTGSRREDADPRYAYQFLALAEGAIHAILRSARTAPVESFWDGTRDGHRVWLDIDRWDATRFKGAMEYPGSGTTTEVTGWVETPNGRETADGVQLVWRETGYRRKGSRSVEFDGEYRATVTGTDMTGAWFSGGRRVAGLTMTAAGAPPPHPAVPTPRTP